MNDPVIYHWRVVRTHWVQCDWTTAQRIADHNRRHGQRVHVCKLSAQLHVLWPAG